MWYSSRAKIEFSNWLKVKSELCSPHSFYQFKHVLCKEEVGFFKLLVSKELLDWNPVCGMSV
jgi:hypothetical protein